MLRDSDNLGLDWRRRRTGLVRQARIEYGPSAVIETRPCLERFPAPTAGDIEAAVSILSREPGVRRVWLFGSLAKGRKPDFRSDLDLAVEGLPAERYLSLWAALDEATRLPPDLVRWEEADATLRDEINRWGVLVYERT